jgi:long-chain acyl-CoA synthetase
MQRELKLKIGERIAIQLPNLIQYLVAVIAAWRLGLVVVNTNPMYSVRELVHQFNDSNVKAVIVLDQFYKTVCQALPETNIKNVVVTRLGDLMSQPKKGFVSLATGLMGKRPKINRGDCIMFTDMLSSGINYSGHSPKLDDVCSLQYTGGTTGLSKGVMLTQRSLLSNIAQCKAILFNSNNSFQGCVAISPLPLYHIFANTLCMGVLPAIQGHSVLIPDPRDIPSFIRVLKKTKFDLFCGLNSLFVALLQNRKFEKVNFSHLRITLSGGMALMESVAHNWQRVTGCIVNEGYGMTEASPVVTANPPGAERIGTVGVPLPGTEVKVIDEQGLERKVGESGELCIKGNQVMQGYWQCPEQTQQTIVDGWLHTGDVVVLDDQGYIKIVDRLKDMIVVSGFNVYPNELEQVLTLHPDVMQCAAIGCPDTKSGEVVKMFVVSNNSELTSNDIIMFCKEHMAPYKVPKCIEFRDELPMSNVGKVLRKDLKAEMSNRIN